MPTFFEGTALLVVLFFCKILYEGCYTMFNIPMGSMISAMSETDEERASLSSARGFGSAVGNLLPTLIFLPCWQNTETQIKSVMQSVRRCVR